MSRAKQIVEQALRRQLKLLVEKAKKATAALDEYSKSWTVYFDCQKQFFAEVKQAQETGNYDSKHLSRIKDIKARMDKAETLSKKSHEVFFDAHHNAWADVRDYVEFLSDGYHVNFAVLSQAFIAEIRQANSVNPFSREKIDEIMYGLKL